MKLVVGLGNPGKEYRNNRHNIGFLILDYYVEKIKQKFRKKKLYFFFQTDKAIFIKPRTFMNRSGYAVASALEKYEIDDLMVIVDDIYLDFGTVRLRKEGSFGGHNGLKSVFHETGKIDFKRLRVGIGSPEDISLRDFVLEDFRSDEQKILNEIYQFSFSILENYVQTGFDESLNFFSRNKKSYSEKIHNLRIG